MSSKRLCLRSAGVQHTCMPTLDSGCVQPGVWLTCCQRYGKPGNPEVEDRPPCAAGLLLLITLRQLKCLAWCLICPIVRR